MSELPKSLKMAPSADKVFIRPDYHSRYVLPLLSLELSDVFDDLSGPIHFIDPIEPYDGCIGESTEQFHTYYCRMNWISFKLKDGLYECEAPEAFFAKHYFETHPVPDHIHHTVRDRWVESVNAHYDERRAKYAEWRSTLSEDLDAALERLEIRPDSFGRRPFDQNWAHCSSFPLVTDKEEVAGKSYPDEFHYPLTEDGRRFRYVGYAGAFDWSCTVHLFYDPIEQRALQTFDWT